MMPSWLARVSVFLATGFGSGFFPMAPGTVGTLVAYPLYWIGRQWLPTSSLAFFGIATFVIGIGLCHIASQTFGEHDASQIVIDEIVAMFLILCLIPESWAWQIVAFIAFRFFDILKPFPIGWLDQHVKGGLGIMLDDVMAGIYALIVLGILWGWQHGFSSSG